MIKILYFLFLIRLRKIISKDDFFGITLILLLYFSIVFVIYKNYNTLNNYMFLFFLDIVINYVNRKDLELLRLNKNFKIILFCEYFIYLLPFYIIFLLKKEFVLFFGFIVLKIILLNVPKINLKTIPYPFQLFNPFWHITFRKYKLIYLVPIIPFLIYIAIDYKNENIIYFTFVLLALISCMPSFERERFEEIKASPFEPEKYLFRQFKNSIINTSLLILPIAIVLFFLLKWNLLLFLLVVLIIPIINILLKYTFFTNSFLQQIAFVFFVGLTVTMFGIPLLAIPYLYNKSIKTINIIKYANH
jgi:hypothetical protein